MAISIRLPEGVERHLRAEVGNLDQEVKELALVGLYREGKISHSTLAVSLGISRYATDAVLKRHNVTEDLITLEEFDEQVAGLNKMLGE